MFCYTDSGRKEKIQVPKLWKILCWQKFTKQTHKKYLHYEYPKFWLVFEFIKVMHFDTSIYVLMRFDAFRRVLTCFDWCPEELWKNVRQYEFRPKVHSTNTSKIPALWIPKVKVLQYRLKPKGNFMLTKVLNSWMFLHNAIHKIIDVLQIQC